MGSYRTNRPPGLISLKLRRKIEGGRLIKNFYSHFEKNFVLVSKNFFENFLKNYFKNS